MTDLDWAASKLPHERQTGDNVGRIDRWGALAMKARIALQNERYDIAAKACQRDYRRYSTIFMIMKIVSSRRRYRE